MTNLRSTHPHFVRCLIPNETKTPGMSRWHHHMSSNHTSVRWWCCFERSQASWSIISSSISWDATASWRELEFVGRASPAESYMGILSNGEPQTSIRKTERLVLMGVAFQVQSPERQRYSWGTIHWQQKSCWKATGIDWCRPHSVQVWTHQGHWKYLLLIFNL